MSHGALCEAERADPVASIPAGPCPCHAEPGVELVHAEPIGGPESIDLIRADRTCMTHVDRMTLAAHQQVLLRRAHRVIAVLQDFMAFDSDVAGTTHSEPQIPVLAGGTCLLERRFGTQDRASDHALTGSGDRRDRQDVPEPDPVVERQSDSSVRIDEVHLGPLRRRRDDGAGGVDAAARSERRVQCRISVQTALQPVQRAGDEDIVGVEEVQVPRLGGHGGRACVARRCDAGVRLPHDAKTRIPPGERGRDLDRSVRAAVVDDHDLELDPVLGEHAGERRLDVGLGVVGGNDHCHVDRHASRVYRRRRSGPGAQIASPIVSAGTPAPLVSAVICTRGRGSRIVTTIDSILASDHPSFELIVVDQSDDDTTQQAVSSYLTDRRVRYVHRREAGLGRARNAGLAEARSDIVLFTDDDVTVPRHWLATMQRGIEQHPEVAVAFCNVDAAPHDREAGFVPAYHRTGTIEISSTWQKCRARGIGAGLGVRRTTVLAVGGFDPMLGAGAEFPSCEDGDIALRSLLAGHRVLETDAVAVVHDGFRSWAEGRDLTRRDWYGIGAAYSKPIRVGRLSALPVVLWEGVVVAALLPVAGMIAGKWPPGVRRAVYFWKGFVEGFRRRVDPDTLLFLADDSGSGERTRTSDG